MMNNKKDKINRYCDKTIEVFLYILIFCLPFSKAIIEISATFMILAWIVKIFFNRRLISTYLNIPIFFFIVATFLSVLFSSNLALSLKNFISKTMEYIFLYYIVAEFVFAQRKVKRVLSVMLASAAMIGIDCIFQYFFGFDFLRHRSLEAGRMTGSFQMPGDLAGFLGPMLCISVTLSFLQLKKMARYSLRLLSIALLSLLFLLFARGAWIAFLAAVCFLGLVGKKKVVFAAIVALVILGLLIPHLKSHTYRISNLQRLKSIVLLSDASNLDRKAIWGAALRMIKARPWFGHGLSTFMGNFTRYAPDYFFLEQGIIPYAHNCYLQIGAETGIIGLLSFLILIATFFIHTIIFLRRIKDKFHHAALSGISAGIIATLVHSAVDTNLYSLQLSVLFWVMLGLNAGLSRLNEANPQTDRGVCP